MHILFDPRSLSDDELLSKIDKAYSYLNNQTQAGHNTTAQSIRDVLEALREESRRRASLAEEAEFKKKFPDSLKPIEIGKLED